jgi:hypothetical protein
VEDHLTVLEEVADRMALEVVVEEEEEADPVLM